MESRLQCRSTYPNNRVTHVHLFTQVPGKWRSPMLASQEALRLSCKLAIGDQQVRRLLGVLPMPAPEQIEARAERTVEQFLTLFGAERSTQ
jgi:hypothetical protein